MLKKGDKVKVNISRNGSLEKGTLATIADISNNGAFTWYWVEPLDERIRNGLMYPYDVNELLQFTKGDEEMLKKLIVETDEYVAKEIVKLFMKDDPKGYVSVRKQILKKKDCDYFKKG